MAMGNFEDFKPGDLSINGQPVHTPSLFNQEEQQELERRAKISKVTIEFENMLLRENMTMGDMLEIFGLLTARANNVFSKITIKKIQEDYGKI